MDWKTELGKLLSALSELAKAITEAVREEIRDRLSER
jgi:hypothetical protein